MYIKNLKKLVCKKYKYDQEKISIWFAKHTASRRLYLKKMWDKDNRCVYCKNETVFKSENSSTSKFIATYEHKIPLSKGGTDARSNAALSCNRCNNLKGNMTHDEFIAFINDSGSINEALRISNNNKKFIALQKNLVEKIDNKSKVRLDIRAYIIAIMMFDSNIKKMVEKILQQLEKKLINKQIEYDRIKNKIKSTFSDFVEVSL